jgi:hypothetical protein
VEFNRNHYFLIGLVLFLLGVQLRAVDSYVLNQQTTQMLAERFGSAPQAASMRVAQYVPPEAPGPRKTVHPPMWLGYSLMSIGAVLILHSLAMTKPGG